jgi:hypothetical protein
MAVSHMNLSSADETSPRSENITVYLYAFTHRCPHIQCSLEAFLSSCRHLPRWHLWNWRGKSFSYSHEAPSLTLAQRAVKALARYTNGNAHIVVVGRNEAAANSIIASLPKHENSQYEFVSCDATLVRNVKTVTADPITRLPKLNFLVETSGYLMLNGREETDEGIDRKMALNFYSRWQFADNLLPLLKKAKEEGEDAKVCGGKER